MNCHIVILILIIISLPAVATGKTSNARHWNKDRGYSPFSHAHPDGILLSGGPESPAIDSCHLSDPTDGYSLTFRASAGKAPWGFFVSSGASEKIWITVSQTEEADPLSSSAALKISAYIGESRTPTITITRKKGLDLHSGPNIWRLATADTSIILSAGNHSLLEILTIPGYRSRLTTFGFASAPGGELRVEDISLVPHVKLEKNMTPMQNDTGHLREYLVSTKDSLEGYWTVFDRTLDENLLRMGGDYRFVLVRDEIPGSYRLIYIDGAVINAGKWQPGMTKAKIKEELFPGIYNVTWIDAEGKSMDKDIKAQLVEPDVLQIQFPYQSSMLRLRRHKYMPG